MDALNRVVVFQTAFTGDVILTLPMIQRLKRHIPHSAIDLVATPSGAAVAAHHPALRRTLVYDKKGADRGLAAAFRLAQHLRKEAYDAAIIPHRSIRSAAICYGAGIPRRIGFSTSSGRFLMSDVVRYDAARHEILRNLALLAPLGAPTHPLELPSLYPSPADMEAVNSLLEHEHPRSGLPLVALAPGSVWATKRWLPERYRELAQRLTSEGFRVVMIGGHDDLMLGNAITAGLEPGTFINAMGKLTVLQAAELIRRCTLAVTNDSSPMHLATAMRTPVIAIFGATVPALGFAPVGKFDRVVETNGLRCRPCAIHGGNRCPIGSFDCMKNITVTHVLDTVHDVLSSLRTQVESSS